LFYSLKVKISAIQMIHNRREAFFGEKINKPKLYSLRPVDSAQNWNRTSTPLLAADFESAASTNFAIWAADKSGCNSTIFWLIARHYNELFFRVLLSAKQQVLSCQTYFLSTIVAGHQKPPIS
jgi:hypothetical protein